MNNSYTSKNIEDTIVLAQNLESEKFPNMVICLNGELGSGKTVFVKGFASAMGIQENITSPTFNIIKEYLNGELPLNHMDAYRFEDEDESLGLRDYFNNGGVTIIEWPENVAEFLPKERLDIEIKIIDENKRIFKLTPHGERYEEIVNFII